MSKRYSTLCILSDENYTKYNNIKNENISKTDFFSQLTTNPYPKHKHSIISYQYVTNKVFMYLIVVVFCFKILEEMCLKLHAL